MARQYFETILSDSLIVPAAAVSPATSLTSLFSAAQANKYLPLPYGQNAPSPGQIFRVTCGGLFTSVAGTFIFTIYHGTGTGGTLLATSATVTGLAYTAGSFRFEGDLIYRSVSETATTSTAWLAGVMVLAPPSGNTNASITIGLTSAAAVSVDTTGTGSAGTFGAMTIGVTPGTTGSTFTPEYAFIRSMN
jgi:hypothetical protein